MLFVTVEPLNFADADYTAPAGERFEYDGAYLRIPGIAKRIPTASFDWQRLVRLGLIELVSSLDDISLTHTNPQGDGRPWRVWVKSRQGEVTTWQVPKGQVGQGFLSWLLNQDWAEVSTQGSLDLKPFGWVIAEPHLWDHHSWVRMTSQTSDPIELEF